VFDGLLSDRAGHSAQRRYGELSKRWRRRFFGRRATVYARIIIGLLLVLLVTRHPSEGWAVGGGIFIGACLAAIELVPEVFVPSHIFNWQLGAWGEQNTASELKRLKRSGWTVRHDVHCGARGNHDHVVANGSVFVLNSKNVKDSRVTIEEHGLRVERLDDPGNSYLADRWLPQVAKEAWSLKIELGSAVDFPVHVYPVIVVWGGFEVGSDHVNDVAVVQGDQIAAWLEARPADLLTAEKRARVAAAVRALPAA
jgi:hypothetical protein